MDDFVHIGDTISIHPSPLDSLTLFAEGAGSWAVKIAAPSKSRQRNLAAHLAFFTIELCVWTEGAVSVAGGGVNRRGEVVKVGDDIALRHVHTGGYFSVARRREDCNLTFELTPEPNAQTWVRVSSPIHQDIGQPLKYSQQLCLITQLFSVDHYLSVSSFDGDVTYNAYASAEESFVLFRPVAGWGRSPDELGCHQVVLIRHTKSRFLLTQPLGSDLQRPAYLTTSDPSERIYWSFERLMELQSGLLVPGHSYYLRNLSTGAYLTSSYAFASVPGPAAAFVLRSKGGEGVKQGQNEVFFETREHTFVTCREDRPFFFLRSWAEYYEVPGLKTELRAELTADKAFDGSEMFSIEAVSAGVSTFVKTAGDTVSWLRTLAAAQCDEDCLELVLKAVESILAMLDASPTGEDLLRKQAFAGGLEAAEAAIRAGSAVAGREAGGEETTRKVVQGLMEMVKGLVKRNRKGAESVLPLASLLLDLLPVNSYLVDRILISVFKQIDLQTSDQILHCQLWVARLSPVTDANVLEQTQLLKLLKSVAEVRGLPSLSSQEELAKMLLWHDTLLSVSLNSKVPWVHFSLFKQVESRPMAELSDDYVEFVFRAFLLLATICDYNYVAAIEAVKGKMGFTDEFLLTAQCNQSISASLRAGLVLLSRVLICFPAESANSAQLRTPGNLVFSREEVAQGLQRRFLCSVPEVEQCGQLEVQFWTDRGATSQLLQETPHSCLRLISAHLRQVSFLLSSGLAGPQFCSLLRPALLRAAISLTGNEASSNASWPVEVLHRLVTDSGEEEEITEIGSGLMQAISDLVTIQTSYSVLSTLTSSSISFEGTVAPSGVRRLLSGWLGSAEEMKVEEVMLRVLFCGGKGVEDLALEGLQGGGVEGRMEKALRETVIVETEEEADLWEHLRARITVLSPFHIRAAYSESLDTSSTWVHIRDDLQAVLNLLFLAQYRDLALREKVRNMARSLGLEGVVRHLGALLRNVYSFTEFWFEVMNLIVLLATQCVSQHAINLRSWVYFSPGTHFVAIPCAGLLVKQLTNFDYLRRSELEVISHIISEATNAENKFAVRFTAFLMYLVAQKEGARTDVQLITSYRVVEAINRHHLLFDPSSESLLTQFLHLLSLCARDNPLVHAHLHSSFTYPYLLAQVATHRNLAVAEACAALLLEIYREEGEVMKAVEERMQVLRKKQCFEDLARYAGEGRYTKAWRRTEAGKPYSVHRYWSPAEDALLCWEALFNEDILGFETGFLVTLANRRDKKPGSMEVVLVDILEGVRKVAGAHPELCFWQLESALNATLSAPLKLDDSSDQCPTSDKELTPFSSFIDTLLTSSLLPTSKPFASLASALLKIEGFYKTSVGCKRFAAVIRSIVARCGPAQKPFLFDLLTEVCRQVRHLQGKNHTEAEKIALQELTNTVWIDSTIVEVAVMGIRKCSFRCVSSLRFLAEVTTEQTYTFQTWLLSVLRESVAYLPPFLLLKETLIGLVNSNSAGKPIARNSKEVVILMLRIVRNASESSFDELQQFFLSQKGESGRLPSVNVVLTIADFIVAGLPTLARGSSTSSFVELVDEALETLINLVTGPCIPSQRLLLTNSNLLCALMRLIRATNDSAHDLATSAARLHTAILLNTLVEGELDRAVEVELLKDVDIPLLIACLEREFTEHIAGRENEVGAEQVADPVRSMHIEFAFEVYTFLLEVREMDPSAEELRRLTAFPQERVGWVMLLVKQYVRPFKFSHSDCFGYFGSNVGYVEIAKQGKITSTYFRIPPRCKYLSRDTKTELVNIQRTSRMDVLQKVLLKMPQLDAEMLHQQQLSRWPWLRTLVHLWRPMWIACLLIVISIDLIMLCTSDEFQFYRFAEASEQPPKYEIVLGTVLSWMSIAHYLAYMVEYYPKIVVTSGRYKSLDFDLYPFIPHCDSLMMVPWSTFSDRMWVKRLPTLISRLQRLLFSRQSFIRLLFIAFTFLSFRFPLFYSVMLLWYMSTNQMLTAILSAISTNFRQLVLTAAFCVIVVYAFSALYFQKFEGFYRESGDGKAQYSTYCTTLYICFLSTLDWGLRSGIGDALAQVNTEHRDYRSRLALDLLFWVLINVIILKIVFGIILDTFKELREARLRSDKDMTEKCFICNRTRSQLERSGKGWSPHFSYEHSLFAYVAYIVHVSQKATNRCSGVELYVKTLVAKQDPAFFPQTAKYFEEKGLKFEEEDE